MGSTPKPPKVPKFTPVNIPDAIAQAIAYDTQGFDASDALFASQFPGLVTARKNEIADALKQVTGPLDPALQSQFTREGIEKALGATGGGTTLSSVDPTGMGGNVVAQNVATNVLNKNQQDIDYVDQLLQQNPLRSYGLSGPDVAQLAIFNARQGNVASVANYNAQIAGINAQGAAGAQTGAAIAGLGSSIMGLSAALAKSDVRLKEDIVHVGTSPSGLHIYEFTYRKGIGLPEGRWRGVLAQEVMEVRPSQVHVDSASGYFTVDYFGLDVAHERVDI